MSTQATTKRTWLQKLTDPFPGLQRRFGIKTAHLRSAIESAHVEALEEDTMRTNIAAMTEQYEEKRNKTASSDKTPLKTGFTEPKPQIDQNIFYLPADVKAKVLNTPKKHEDPNMVTPVPNASILSFDAKREETKATSPNTADAPEEEPSGLVGWENIDKYMKLLSITDKFQDSTKYATHSQKTKARIQDVLTKAQTLMNELETNYPGIGEFCTLSQRPQQNTSVPDAANDDPSQNKTVQASDKTIGISDTLAHRIA